MQSLPWHTEIGEQKNFCCAANTLDSHLKNPSQLKGLEVTKFDEIRLWYTSSFFKT